MIKIDNESPEKVLYTMLLRQASYILWTKRSRPPRHHHKTEPVITTTRPSSPTSPLLAQASRNKRERSMGRARVVLCLLSFAHK
jgi:hypothetical protein